MGLHHIVSLYLFGGCYITNAWEAGMTIAYLHDTADITTNIVKGLAESIYGNAAAVVFVIHMVIWGWTRNIVLPFESIWHIYLYCPDFEGYTICKPMFIYLLCCMCLLHYYWYAMFIRMLKKYTSSGVAED